MDLQLKGLKALVTGSTKGIGKAIAAELAREGADVVINGRNSAETEAVAARIKELFPGTEPIAAPADLAIDEQRLSLFEMIPEVDILVNNMGIFEPMPYWEITKDVWEKFFNVNVLAGDALARFYLPGMLKRNSGRIIFIASEEAIMPSGEMAQYSMTKSMNLSLAKSLSKLTKGTKVTVNTIMPGSTLTEGVEAMLEQMYGNSDLPKSEWEHVLWLNTVLCRKLSV